MISLALIGIGAWGKNYLAVMPNINNKARIKYVCSKSDASLDSIKGDYIKTNNYKSLLLQKDIKGVIIATPNSTHFELASEFLNKGIDVLIEKPIVEDYRQAEKLKLIQNKTRAKLQVGHIYLFDPAYIEAKKLVKSIGKIRYINFEGTNNGPIRPNTSALWDIGTHAVALCLDIYSEKPKSISAWAMSSVYPKTNYYDFSSVKIVFEDEVEAFIKVSWLFPFKRRELVIVGKKNTIIYDDQNISKISVIENVILKNDKSVSSSADVSRPKYSSVSPLEMEISDFVDAIEKNKKITKSNLDFGISVTKIINLAEESIRKNGKPMNIS